MTKQRFFLVLLGLSFLLTSSVSVMAVEKTVAFKTGKVAYTIEGEGENTLVFVHCWTCNKDFWKTQIEFFKTKFKVIAIDLPGHGQSDKPEVDYTINLYADSVKEVMNHVGIKQAIMIGHSMGVPVNRQFYRKYPESVKALVVVDSFMKFELTEQMQKMMSNMIKAFRSEKSEQFTRMFIGSMFVPQSPAGVKKWVIDEMLKAPKHVRASAMKGIWNTEIWINDKVDVPVLVIRAKTPQLRPDTAKNVKSVAQDSRLEIWEGVGHFLQLEKPKKFNTLLTDFFKSKGFVK